MNNIYLKVAANTATVHARSLKAMEKSIRRHSRKTKSNKTRETLEGNASIVQTLRHSLRVDARALHLVRAFLKGTPYLVVENKAKTQPSLSAVTGWLWEAESNHSVKEFEEWMLG